MAELNSEFLSYLKKKMPRLGPKSAQAVLQLAEEGATVPFIARYRKEKTGNLDEVQIRGVIHSFSKWNELVKRKLFILEEVEKQGNLTSEFKAQIEKSFDLAEIEELYRPFKRKKKSKAKLAKEAGLGTFADWIWRVGHGDLKDGASIEIKAKEYINASLGFATYDEVLRGAQHIIVEKLSNNAELRKMVRDDYFSHGVVKCKVGKKYKSKSKFEKYVNFEESVKVLQNKKASHRYLALKRGWSEGELMVTIEASDEELLKAFQRDACTALSSQASDFLKECAKVALKIHVVPSVVNELHRKLKENADEFAIQVFAENLRRVLMSSPFGPKVVLGVDPGLKTGCKLALVDNNGQYISDTVIKLLSDAEKEQAKKLFAEVFNQIKIEIIAVGNGTGGREAEVFIRDTVKELKAEVPVVLVNEAGASVYSASDVARTEFPNLDVSVRGAISIARRLQDPLAELVKIEPKSIGVGQYQHDVGQPELKNSLHEVVESCVNNVGVNLNTASSSLLQYVSGIGPAIASNVVTYRAGNGLFKDRKELEKVPNFSSKTFEQAAGFLRVLDGKHVLDATGIHPERYGDIELMAKELNLEVSDLVGKGATKLLEIKDKWVERIGEFTFADIITELQKPGRDPRDVYKVFKFREDIHELKDLKKDMICPGVVTNVTNFGAFVDIGVHQDGLVHLSQISHEFVDDPKLVVSPGDQVQVKVLDADIEKSQISLSMLLTEKPARPERSKAKEAGGRSKGAGRGRGRNADRSKETQARGAKGGDSRRKGKPSRGKRPDQKRPGKGSHRGGPRKPKNPFNNPFAALNDINKGE